MSPQVENSLLWSLQNMHHCNLTFSTKCQWSRHDLNAFRLFPLACDVFLNEARVMFCAFCIKEDYRVQKAGQTRTCILIGRLHFNDSEAHALQPCCGFECLLSKCLYTQLHTLRIHETHFHLLHYKTAILLDWGNQIKKRMNKSGPIPTV